MRPRSDWSAESSASSRSGCGPASTTHTMKGVQTANRGRRSSSATSSGSRTCARRGSLSRVSDQYPLRPNSHYTLGKVLGLGFGFAFAFVRDEHEAKAQADKLLLR